MTTAPIAPPAVAKKRRRLSFACWLLDLSTLFISIRLSDRCGVVFPVAGLLAEARYATAETEVQAASLRATRRVMKPLAEPRLSPKAVSYTHPRAHETPEHPVCRLPLEKK